MVGCPMAGQNSIYIMSHPCLCDKMMSVDVSEYKILLVDAATGEISIVKVPSTPKQPADARAARIVDDFEEALRLVQMTEP